jgi:hypothetical protein
MAARGVSHPRTETQTPTASVPRDVPPCRRPGPVTRRAVTSKRSVRPGPCPDRRCAGDGNCPCTRMPRGLPRRPVETDPGIARETPHCRGMSYLGGPQLARRPRKLNPRRHVCTVPPAHIITRSVAYSHRCAPMPVRMRTPVRLEWHSRKRQQRLPPGRQAVVREDCSCLGRLGRLDRFRPSETPSVSGFQRTYVYIYGVWGLRIWDGRSTSVGHKVPSRGERSTDVG